MKLKEPKSIPFDVFTDADLEEISHVRGKKTLRIRGKKVRDFSPLLSMKDLRKLEVFNFAHGDMGLLGRLHWLKSLLLDHVPQVHELNELSKLVQLQDLSLCSLASWDASGKTFRFKTLRPLQKCTQLRKLAFMKVTVEEDGLKPLHGLHNLRVFQTDNTFSLEDFALMAGALPKCKGDYLVPFHQPYYSPSCTRCGRSKIQLSGVRRGGSVCANCNAARVKAHIAEFEQIAGRIIPHAFRLTRRRPLV